MFAAPAFFHAVCFRRIRDAGTLGPDFGSLSLRRHYPYRFEGSSAPADISAPHTRGTPSEGGKLAETAGPSKREFQLAGKFDVFVSARVAQAGVHFSEGTTMPRSMIFWQKAKTTNVGIAARMSEA